MSEYPKNTSAIKKAAKTAATKAATRYSGHPILMAQNRPLLQSRQGPDSMSHRTVAIAGAIALLLVFAVKAFSHGPAQWIQDGGYKNAVGDLCCGERDCTELADGDVVAGTAGYHIISLKETVPFHEAQPSPDGKFWRCYWGGKRKCFFAPPNGS